MKISRRYEPPKETKEESQLSSNEEAINSNDKLENIPALVKMDNQTVFTPETKTRERRNVEGTFSYSIHNEKIFNMEFIFVLGKCDDIFNFFFIDPVSASFLQMYGNTGCDQGTSNVLKDFGGGTTLENCQRDCLDLDGCTDMMWAPSNGHCKTLDGCENAGFWLPWNHYVLTGKF